MERQCRKCKGDGGRYRNKPQGSYRGWFSNSREWIKCDACSGTGVNPKYRSKSCERCYGTIGYSSDSKFPPKYCERCKPIAAREKEQARQNRTQSSWSSRPQQQHDSKWREKSCAGCGTTIKYNTEWSNVPKYCKSCSQRELEKNCSVTGCDRKIKYKTSWTNIPDKCGRCHKELERGKTPRLCNKCNKLMFVAPGKSYSTCMDCNQQEQLEKHAQLRRNVPGRRTSQYASSMDQLARSLVQMVGRSDDVYFVELTGPARETWRMPPMKRGENFDKGFDRGNLPYNFPTIDLWDERSGEVTSIKSIDLNASTYHNTNSLDRQVAKYVDQVAQYSGTNSTRWKTEITPSQIGGKTLILIVPLIGVRDYVLNYIYSVPQSHYAANKGVQVVVFVVD